MAFGLEGTMVAVTRDLEKGVVDRFRSLPMANGAVLVGRSAADMMQSALGLTVLIAVGYALGWRAQGGPGAFLGAVGLLLLFRFAMLWIGIFLALVAGKPELVQAVQILVWPVGFLSNAFATPEAMPGWLGTVVQWNPMSQTATAVRDLFGGPGGEPGHVWAAVAWPLALLAVFFPLAVRRFARLQPIAAPGAPLVVETGRRALVAGQRARLPAQRGQQPLQLLRQQVGHVGREAVAAHHAQHGRVLAVRRGRCTRAPASRPPAAAGRRRTRRTPSRRRPS